MMTDGSIQEAFARASATEDAGLLIEHETPRTARVERAPKLPAGLSLGEYRDIEVSLDPDQHAYWLRFKRDSAPYFTMNILREFNRSHRMIHQLDFERAPGEPEPVNYFVACSDIPGVFSYGGDLGLFHKCVAARDKSALLAYALSCVETIYNNAFGFEAPVVSVGIIEGDALGGGFEAALSFNVLIAERGVKMGLPETLFNSFPGMGAFSFLARRLGLTEAEKLILSGEVKTAEQLHQLGVVDILVEKGEARNAAREFIAQNKRRHSLLYAMNKVRQKVHPITLQELREVTEIWVDTMMRFDEADLRRMEVIRSAQLRKLKRDLAKGT